jgi:hypothetical protein
MLAPLAAVTARALQLVQQAAERINLVLVGELLPLGVFHQFQDLIHPFQGLFQGFDDGHHLVDCLADGGTPGCGRRGFRRYLTRRSRFARGGGGQWLRWTSRTGPARAATATAVSSPPAAAARRADGFRRIRTGR